MPRARIGLLVDEILKTFLRVNLVIMFCFLLFTPTLVKASNTTLLKIRADGTPLRIKWHGTWFEGPDIAASLSTNGVINPFRSCGEFKIFLVYDDYDIFLKATGRIIEIYDEDTVNYGRRWVINGEGLVIKDRVDGKYSASFQIRAYPDLMQVSVDIFDDGEHVPYSGEVYIDGIPIESIRIVEGGQEDKYHEKIEKIEEKLSEKQEELEEKLEEKQEKLEEKTNEKHDKMSDKFEEKLDQLEEKYFDELERLEDKIEELEEKYAKKLEKLQEKHDKKQEKIERKYAKKLEKLQEKYDKKLEKILD